MNTPLKLVWKFDSCLDLNTPWIWTETWFRQASSWVKTKIWWWKCDYPAEISYILDISIPEISCVFQIFTFVTSCCSPHISTSQQKSSTECLIWCQSGCVRILPFDRLRGLCHSTVSYGSENKSLGRNICTEKIFDQNLVCFLAVILQIAFSSMVYLMSKGIQIYIAIRILQWSWWLTSNSPIHKAAGQWR